MHTPGGLLGLACLLAGGARSVRAATLPTVSIRTSLGLVNGERAVGGCDRWLGIPYGAPLAT
jgi:hypothetical protein